MEVLVETQEKIYDISEMCKEITWSDTLNEGTSSLQISYLADGLILENGDVVRLTENDQKDGIFFGSVFKVSGDESGVIQIKAYDQLRYTKHAEIVVLENGTLKNLVQNMCMFLSLTPGTIEDPGFYTAHNRRQRKNMAGSCGPGDLRYPDRHAGYVLPAGRIREGVPVEYA